MDNTAIDTPSCEIDLSNLPVHLRAALRRALEFDARAPAPRSAEDAEQCEEQLRAIADEFFGALFTRVLQRAVRSAAVGEAASDLVRHLPRRLRSDGLETVNVRTSRGTTVPVTTPYYREKHHASMSLSFQATAPGEIRIERGNLPARSSRQMVVAESPTRSMTAGFRSRWVKRAEASCLCMMSSTTPCQAGQDRGCLAHEADRYAAQARGWVLRTVC